MLRSIKPFKNYVTHIGSSVCGQMYKNYQLLHSMPVCLAQKRETGNRAPSIRKGREPLRVIHIDHLGHLKSRQGNQYIIAAIDAFTKFSLLRSINSTKMKYVIEYHRDIYVIHVILKILISDNGSCFTARQFKEFYVQNYIEYRFIVLANSRANRQVERLNQAILNSLRAFTTNEKTVE